MFFDIQVELYKKDENKMVYISHNGSSGCEYAYQDNEELISIINDYVDNMITIELDEDDYCDDDDFIDEDDI